MQTERSCEARAVPLWAAPSFRAVAPVSAVCAAFAAQSSAYPPEAPKPDVAPPCGNVAKAAIPEEDRLRAVFGREQSRKRRGRRKA